MAFSGMINLKSGLLTLGGQFDAYKRGQLERNIHIATVVPKEFLELLQFHHVTALEFDILGRVQLGMEKFYNALVLYWV